MQLQQLREVRLLPLRLDLRVRELPAAGSASKAIKLRPLLCRDLWHPSSQFWAKRRRCPHGASPGSKWRVGDSSVVTFVYPYGCSLLVRAPAVPLLSSGSAAYPHKACIAAISQDMTPEAKRARGMPQHGAERVVRGRILVVGSADFLGDDWINKEQNAAVARCAYHGQNVRTDAHLACWCIRVR